MIYKMVLSLFILLLSASSTTGFQPYSPTATAASFKAYKSRVMRPVDTFISKPIRGSNRVKVTELTSSKGGDQNPFYKGQDAYQILDVPRGADKKDIKSSYRKAVATWHPDKFPDDDVKKAEGNSRMEKINRAWYCLGDDDRKRRYDQYGEQGVGTSASSEEQIKAAGSPMGQGGGFGGGRGGGAVDVNDISDIFDAFFGGAQGGRGGGGGQQQQRQRNANAPIAGEDMQVEMEIPFMTALFGGSEKVKIRRLEECGTCTGNGIKPGAKVCLSTYV
jgi:molecular chaperone DnaJ